MNGPGKIAKKILGGLSDFSPSCKAAARLQSEALDRRLSLRQRLGLRLHLALCKWCRRYGRQIAFVREAARTHPDEMTEAVPQPLSDESRARIMEKIRANMK